MHNKALFQAALGLSSPWFVASVAFTPEADEVRGRIVVGIGFKRGGRFPCPECGAPCPAHDTDTQRWRHLAFFQHEAYLEARVPRVRCEEHGVLRVGVPWARPGSGFTLLFEALVVELSKHMAMAAIARLVGENDTRLWRIVRWHVEDARERVDMSAVRAVVVDETSRAKRQNYVTLFLQPRETDEEGLQTAPPRVLFVTEDRDHTVFHRFLADFEAHGGRPVLVDDVCMDMSAAFQRGVSETLPFAQVTFDRFHVVKLVGEAVDDARRRECRAAPELKGTRFDWLLNPADLSEKRRERIRRLSAHNLLTAKAYQMRLTLQETWLQPTAEEARKHLTRWCAWVRRATAEPKDGAAWVLEKMHTAVHTIREGMDRILNYFRLRQTSGVIEGVNGLAQAARARARGYRNVDTFMTMIYLIAGDLEFELPMATHSR